MSETVDLLVVGGGINGAGIANDAAGRGLKVALVEQGDLAAATSSASSKLIHGGLRYLEHFEFRLVRESLAEREVLLAKAPHLVQPLRFVMPQPAGSRPAWLVRLGLFLYDHLARHPSLPNSRRLDLGAEAAGRPLRDASVKAFEYHDCRVDDARLVVLNAMQASAFGARVMTRTRFLGAKRSTDRWKTRLQDTLTGKSFRLSARAIVNAAGPWAQQVRATLAGVSEGAGPAVRLVKGSHIVVPRLYREDHAYTLQNTDGRVVFVIPYLGLFSLIGTTEVPFEGDPATASISAAERDYLLDAVNAFFNARRGAKDIVWDYSGVRPLFGNEEEASAITRDYSLDLDAAPGHAPALTVYGGKLTTYRRLAEEVLAALAPSFPGMARPWTARRPLPGGDSPRGGIDALVAELAREYAKLDRGLVRAVACRHGTLTREVLGDARVMADLGRIFADGLSAREVAYMVQNEWVRSFDDVIWRRTKSGLAINGKDRAELSRTVERALKRIGREAAAHAAT